MRIGIGYDSHRLVIGRKLIIGGVEIPFNMGLEGHSDADVLSHAIIDSIIGALGLGDIGNHFPDTDSRWKDISSIVMLRQIIDYVHANNLAILWIDAIIFAEKPKMQPYIELMKKALSESGIPSGVINIKAKTNEAMGFIGRSEGIAAQAVCLLDRLCERVD